MTLNAGEYTRLRAAGYGLRLWASGYGLRATVRFLPHLPAEVTYLKFLYIALSSACEVKYLVKLSDELGYVGREWNDLRRSCEAVVKQLERLTQTMEAEVATERAGNRNARSVAKNP